MWKSISFYILTGESGGRCKEFDDRLIKVPSKNTAIIQQMHITIGHILCLIAEKPFIWKINFLI